MVNLKHKGIHHTIVIAPTFFPGDGPETPPSEVQKLVQYCKGWRLPFIMGCDANAHNITQKA